MSKKSTRAAFIICALILVSIAGTNAQSKLVSFWDFNRTRPLGGAGTDSLGTRFSYNNPFSTFFGSTDSIDKTYPLFSSYSANAPTTARMVVGGHPAGSVVQNTNESVLCSFYDYSSNHNYFGNTHPYFSSSDSTGSAAQCYIKAINPTLKDTIYMYLPTNGYQNIHLNYAISGSSSKAPNYNIYSYSTNGGGSWNNLTTAMDTFNISGVRRPDTLQMINSITNASAWYPININFTSDPSINNNPNFILRWTFGGTNASGTSANNRYDNFALTADSICPSFISQPANFTACSAGTATFSVITIGGTSPIYQWMVNSGSGYVNATAGIYSGATTNVLTITNTSGLNGYLYECVVSNSSCGNITSNPATLTVDPAVAVSITTFTNVTCTGNGSAIAAGNGGTSPYTYSWSNSQTSATATNLIAGTYTVTVKDNLGCSGTTTATIAQNGLGVSITSSMNVECTPFGSATALASNGNTPYTYSWTDGETTPTATGLSAGSYTVIAKDNLGCTGSISVAISQFASMRDSISSQFKVIHYWDFNNTLPAGGAGGDSLGTSTYPLIAPYSLIAGLNPRIVYSRPHTTQTSPLTATQKDSLLDNGSGGSFINDLHILGNDSTGSSAGNLYIRSRNPDENSYVYLYLPTTGYSNVVLNYAISASSTKGAFYNIFNYSVDGGITWKTLSSAMDTFKTGGIHRADTLYTGYTNAVWYPVQINFSSDPTVNNNSNFIVRWQFEGTGSNGTSANDRYDNISLSGNQSTVTCFGGNNFTAITGVKSGVPPYTYSWSPSGGSSGTASNLTAGTYTLTIKDANNCSVTTAITISQPALLTASISSVTNITCNGYYTGAATATASGGTSPYNYSWSPSGGTLNIINGVNAGTYSVTVTDAVGCTSSTTVTLTQPVAITVTANVLSNVNCLGSSTGVASSSVSGGTSPYTYQWSNATSAATANASNLSAGTYTINVTDNQGCTGSAYVTITQPASGPVVTIASILNVNCFGGTGSVTANAATGGGAPYTYSWSSGGGTSLTTTSLVAGTYFITVSDINGCTSTTSATITQPISALGITINSASNVSCFGGTGTVTANSATGGTSPYTYSWSSSGGTNLTASSFTAGTYSITVTDNHACTASALVTITQPASGLGITINSVSNAACTGNTGTATANAANGGTSPYTYSWSGGGGTNLTTTSLTAGIYIITASDNTGCTASASATITEPASSLSITINSVSNATCFGNTGTATANAAGGGTAPYTYSWSNGGGTNLTSASLPAGIYIITVTDNHACSASASATITQPASVPGITINSVNNVACFRGTGTAIANSATGGTSPYTYSWSNGGGTNLTTTSLSAGTYTITVTDNHDCSSSVSATITQPASALGITINSVTNILCSTGGTATSNAATGGTVPYTYSWSNGGGTSLTATNLSAGTYIITVTDNHDCTASASATITQPASALSVTLNSISNVVCFGGTGTATTNTASGGTSPYTYSWSGSGGTNLTTISLGAGIYTLTVTDNHACTSSFSATITQPASAPGISINSVNNVACFGGTGTATANAATGGTAPYTYSWSGSGGSNLNTTSLAAGIYSITVTDNHACTASASATITQPASVVTITLNSVSNVACSGNTGTAVANAAIGGTSPYTYSWSNGGGTNLTASNLSAGTYTLTVSDNHACSASVSATISQPASALSISLNSINNVVCFGGTGTATANAAIGGSSPYTYSWSGGGGTNLTTTTLTAGIYTITVTDSHSCTVSASATITQPTSVFGIAISSVNNVACLGGTGSATSRAATGGTSPYTYSWSGSGGTNLSTSSLTAGIYVITATDNHGCSTSTSATITQPASLVGITINSVSNISCTTIGAIAANAATGGTSPYTYSWTSGGGTNLTASNLTAGTYTITVTDNHACTASASATVTQPAAALSITINSISNVVCFGGTGIATSNTANGGTPPYTYSWNGGGGTNLTTSALPAGTYTITVNDNNNCIASASTVITQAASALGITISSVSNVACSGGTGTATANAANGGSSPYTYSWSGGGGTNLTTTSLGAGTYSITVTDNHACTASTSAIINQSPLIRDSISGQFKVITYWDFNNTVPQNGNGEDVTKTPPGIAADSLGTAILPLPAQYSLVSLTNSKIVYSRPQGLQSGATKRDSTLDNGSGGAVGGKNYEYTSLLGNDTTGLATGNLYIRSRQPNENAYVYMYLPTTGYQNIVLNYAISASSSKGAQYNVFSYSTNGGSTWKNLTTVMDTFNIHGVYRPDTLLSVNSVTTGGNWYPVQINFSSDPSVNNNSGFVVRFQFEGSNSFGTSGNNRYDNISISGNQSTESCFGGNNFTAVVGVKNGVAPYTYSWTPNVSSSGTASNITAGTYSVTVKDINGCSSSSSITISQPALVSASIISSTNITCNGFFNGAATATASGGTSPYNYSWSPSGGTINAISGVSAGTYTVNVTDGVGCTSSASVTLSQPAAIVANAIVIANVNCSGNSTGSASSSVSGGTSPYTYSWSNGGGTNLTASGLSAGIYTLTVSDNHACTATTSATITQPSAVSITIYSVSNVSCFGGTGTATANVATGGTAPYTYLWSSAGGTNLTTISLVAGIYNVTVTDNNGCTASVSATITQPALSLGITLNSVNNVACFGGTGTATANAATGGTLPYTYSWSGAGGSNLTTTSLAAGIYTITVTDNHSCTTSALATITQPASALGITLNSVSNVACAGNTGSATANAANGGTAPYTYSWSNGGGTNLTATGLSAGIYSVTVTDSHACTASVSATITQPVSALGITISSVTNIACFGGTGSVIANAASGGNSPYTYSWSGGLGSNLTITSLSAGTYSITVTDNHSCTASASATITQPASGLGITINSISNAACFGGTATASANTATGGTSPYTYSWNSGGGTNLTTSSLTAGIYIITATDNHGCTTSTSATITQPLAVGISISSVTNPICNGGNGSAIANVATGGVSPYTYLWAPSGGTSLTASVSAGTYTITATDNHGCTATALATITQPLQIRDSVSVAGQLEVIHYWDFNNTLPAGGGGGDSLGTSAFPLPAEYSLIPGTNPKIIYSRPQGLQAGATKRDSILDNLLPTTPPTPPYCYINDLHILGNDSGSSATGNLGIRSRNPDENAYMYLYLPTTGYSNVVLNYAISGSSTKSALYNIFSYSTNGGSTWKNLNRAMDTFNIGGIYRPDTLQFNNPVTTVSAWYPVQINFSSDPSINNNPNFIVRWEFEGGGSNGTSGNSRYDNISLSGDIMTETCVGGNQIAATAGAKYGTPPYTYSWTPGGGSGSTSSNLSAGTYTLTIKDANGCSVSSTVTVSNPPVLTATISSATNITCFGGINGTATASATGGQSHYSYSWAPTGGTASNATGLSAGTFTITVTDAFGCNTTASVTITQPAALIASISTFTNVTCNVNGSATAGVTNGTSPYTYSWSNSQTAITATNLTAGTYTINVTDNHGCTATSSVTITQPANTVSVSIIAHTNVECTATGSATAVASGGTPPYTYSWTDGETTAIATALSAGTYTITVTDGTGCNANNSVTITQAPEIRDSISAVGQYMVIHYWDFNNTPPSGGAGGDSLGTSTYPLPAQYTLIPGASPRITFSRPSTLQAGATLKDSILDNLGGGSGYYDLSTTDAAAPWYNPTVAAALGNDSAGANLGIRSRNPDENSFMYLYLPTTGYSNINLNYAISASSSKGAFYNILSYSTNGGITWKNLTKAMDTFNISGVYRPDTLRMINPTTSSGGWYPVQINFSSDPSVNNNAFFILRWQFEGSGSNGTSGNDRYDNFVLSGNFSTETCYGGNQVTATAGIKNGTLPYTYSWAPTGGSSGTASNLTAGTYTLTVQDANGCSVTSSVTVSQPALLSANITSLTNIPCNGYYDGAATVSASGGTSPYNYSWSPSGGTINNINGVNAGTYTVTVSDIFGCSASSTVILTQPPALFANAGVTTNVNCNGANTGSASSIATGGTMPYTYLWSDANSQTTANASGLSAGTYTLTVSDSCSSSVTLSVTISQPPLLGITISSVTNVSCFGGTGTATATIATGGTSPYTYAWSNAGGNNLATTQVSAGTYTITVTDNSGCTATAAAVITQPASPLGITIASVSNISCSGGTGTLLANTATGGTSPYTYSWSNGGGTNLTATGLSAGIYIISVSDNNGCNSSISATVSQPASLLGITIASVSNAYCLGSAGSAIANPATGGTLPYTYSWSPAGGTNLSATGLSAGVYVITATDSHGCSASSSATISQPASSLGITISSVTNVHCYQGVGSIIANPAVGGTSPYTYTWSPYGGNNLTALVTAGTYTITATDNNGCTGSTTATVTQPPLLGISMASVSNVLCYGGTGTLTANAATGGLSPYTYTWSPTGGTNLTAVVSPGTYTVIVVDNNGCTATASATITQPASAVGISIASVSNVLCNGGSGSATANAATGGISPYTYTWNDGSSQSGLTASGLSAGTYAITVNDNNGCIATATITVTQPASALGISIASVTNISCGIGSGSATANAATGGTAPYTYLWSDGSSQATLTATGLSAGTYTISVSDNNGCTATATATITQPASSLGVSISGVTNVSCNGGTGSASASASGGSSPYTYLWNDSRSQATASATGLLAGTYTISVTDNNGCNAVATATITQPSALGISIASVSNVLCNGGSGSATANAATGGTSPYTYTWNDGSSQTALTATGLTAGSYTITVIDNNGCSTTASAIITQPASALGISIASVANISCGIGSGSATANAATGGTAPYTYLWSDGSSQATLTATGLSAGTYTISVSDNNGCNSIATATITQPASSLGVSISGVTNVSCNGGTGSASASASGGSSPYTYLWNDSRSQATASATGLLAGTYTISVTDNNGCNAVATATITQPSALGISIASVSNVLCNGGSGSATANAATGGTSPYTYTWNDGSSQTALTATGLTAGSYTITVIDNNGCSTTASAIITQPASALGISIASVTNISCGIGSGSATANAATGGTAPYTYLWSDGSSQATLTATGLSAGTYTISVSDNNGCTATATATITQPASSLGVSISGVTNVSCNGGTGSASASASGGSSPYTYEWNDGSSQATATATGLSAGTYSVTVTDNNGCSGTAAATISQPANALAVTTAVSSSVSCNGLSNGSGSVSVSGGSAPYTYSWSNGATGTSISGVSAGTYTVLVSDNNGCSATGSMNIGQPNSLTATTVASVNVSCNGGANGQGKVSAAGGSSPYTYSWSPNSNSSYLSTGLSAGTYTVTITDRNGCSTSGTVTVTQPAVLRDSIASVSYPGCAISTGSATIGVRGGTSPYIYSWTPNVSSTATATGLTVRSYTVLVKDAKGCYNYLTVSISQPPALRDSIVSASTVNVTCGLTNNGSAKVGVKYGTAPYTYSWTPGGATTAAASGLTVGTYTVTVRDANTCSVSATVVIGQTPGLTLTAIVAANITCNGNANGQAKVTVTGGYSPYTYSWTPGGNSTYITTGLSAGTYSVTVTDKYGCTNVATVTLSQPASIRDSVSSISYPACYAGGGSATIGVKGGTSPYHYSWTPNVSTTATATGLTARSYSVQVKDNNGCYNTVIFTITQPAVVRDSIVRAATVNVLCNGSGTGSATVGVKYGSSPFTYSWSPGGGSNATATGLSARIYTVTVKDGCANTATASVTITQPSALRDSISSSTCNSGLITATAGVKGGVSPYTYSWSPNTSSTARATGLSAGSYTVTITDKNGCSIVLNASLNCGATVLETNTNDGSPAAQCCPPGAIYNVNLYPNPNSGQFTIAGVEKGMTVEVYDYTGRKVSVISVGDITLQLNISGEPNGVYLVRILDKDGNLISEKKVVKVQ